MKEPTADELLVIATIPPPVTGMTLVTQNFIKMLERDCEVDVRNIRPHVDRARGIAVVLKGLDVAAAVLYLIRCGNAIRRKPVYMVSYSGWGLLFTLVLVKFASLSCRAVYLHHHAYKYIGRYSSLAKMIDRSLHGSGTHIFLHERMLLKFQEIYGSGSRATVLSNPIFIDSSIRPNSIDKKLRSVGFLSNLSAAKGTVTFVSVAMRMIDERVPLKFVVAGPFADEDSRLAVLDAVRSRPEKFEYRGVLDAAGKAKFFSSIDAFIFPSRYVNEAQPLVLLEALRAGLPCIAYEIGSVRAIFGDDGCLVGLDDEFEEVARRVLLGWIVDAESFRAARTGSIQRWSTLLRKSEGEMAALKEMILSRA